MFRPLRRITRRQKAHTKAVPAPVGGWNARDPLDNMAPEDAVLLDNWLPLDGVCVTRRGFTEASDGGTGTVKTLVEYNYGTTRKLLGAEGGNIYDYSGATASSLASSFTEDAWQTANFNGNTFFVNGADTLQVYNGSTCGNGSFTGVTQADLVNVTVFKSRLYFVEKDTQSFWYGGVNAVAGALTKFDLAQVAGFGGNLIALAVLNIDGGDGVDDLLCCIMSSGAVIVYQGTDPGSDFAQVGVFYIGEPLGYRCIVKYAGDIIIITNRGYSKLSEIIRVGEAVSSRTLSDRIVNAVRESVQNFGANEGWQPVVYPKGNMLIVNVPVSTTDYVQHVMNLNTGRWCRFKGMDGYCWAVYNGELYFGGTDGNVYKADNGLDDNGSPINCDGKPAWNYFGDRSALKRFTAARPIFTSSGTLPLTLVLNTDFGDVSAGYSPPSSSITGATWDEADWDAEDWSGGTNIVQNWQAVTGIGYNASLRVTMGITNQQVTWQSTTYVYEKGGVL